MQKEIVSLSFFRYTTWQNKCWAFTQMGLVPFQLNNVKGLKLGKMLGSGAEDGFSIRPNFSVYGLLCVWEDEASAKAFFEKASLFQSFLDHSKEYWTIFLQTAHTHGVWDGIAPFIPTCQLHKDELVGVITRATIRTKHLYAFWKNVPEVSASVQNKAGRLFSIGIGERPLVQQATFSLWQSSDLMKAYAYQSRYHRDVIQKTRTLGWYKEELFARFKPFKTYGTWEGMDLGI